MTEIHKPKPDPKMMTQTELLAYVHELEADKQELLIRHNLSINAYIAKINAFGKTIKNLKAENARLEEAYQKATGVIATDSLPTAVVDRERFSKAAEEVFDNVKDELDRVAIADFVNQLENALFGGAQ